MIQRTDTTTNPALRALARVLRPFARILLRAGIPYAAAAEVLKRAYVDVAEREFTVEKRKISTSRISVLTGLTRRDVSKLRGPDPEAPTNEDTVQRYHRAARVVSAWDRSRDRFDPRGIPFTEAADSFSELVRESAGDVPARAVLDELERVGAVEVGDDGRIRLMMSVYVPNAGSPAELDILGADTGRLVGTIDHNMTRGDESPRLQRTIAYDNVPDEALPELRERSSELILPVVVELDRLLASLDRDASEPPQGSGRNTAGFGLFYFEHKTDDNTDDSAR